MRRLLSYGVLIVFSGCLVIPGGSTVTVTGSDTTSETEQHVRGKLVQLQQFMATAAARLTVGRCGARRCYSAASVDELFRAIENRARAAFPPDAAALYETLRASVGYAREELGRAAMQTDFQKVTSPPRPNAYDADIVDQALKTIADAINHLLGFPRLALDVVVDSSPAQAAVDLQVGQNAQTHRGTQTNDHLANVWRGVYTAIVTKNGYRTATKTLDLINDSRTHLRCTLATSNSNRESTCQVE